MADFNSQAVAATVTTSMTALTPRPDPYHFHNTEPLFSGAYRNLVNGTSIAFSQAGELPIITGGTDEHHN
jgi:hypothetical protein